MKQKLFRLSVLMVLLLPGILVQAQTKNRIFEVNGIKYHITDTVNNYVSVHQQLDRSEMRKKNVQKFVGDFVIPQTVSVNGVSYTVTKIGFSAFNNCRELKSITLPNTVTKIESGAFLNCVKLTTINIPNSVIMIGDAAFDKTLWYNNQPDGFVYINDVLYKYKGTLSENSVEIRNGTISISPLVFPDGNHLTSVLIPSSVSHIYVSAFRNCNALKSIVVENGNEVYDSRENCNAIIKTASNELIIGCQKTVIPNTVTSIGNFAFADCAGLAKINIPNSVKAIGRSAFLGCIGLNLISIPNSVTSIGNSAFTECVNLAEVNVYDLFSWCKIDFENADSNPLTYASILKLSGVEIKDLIIPNGITEIKPYTFNKCTSISSLNVPNTVTEIKPYAFDACLNLNSIVIPNSVSSINATSFNQCSGLMTIVVEKGNKVYDSRENCNAIIETESNKLIKGCNTTVIPNTVTAIGNSAFADCVGLTEISIPSSIVYIGSGAFYNSGWYHKQVDGVLYLDNCCLGYKGSCRYLRNLSIKNGTRLICNSAFGSCSNLYSVLLPATVSSIGAFAFSKCKLQLITSLNPEPPFLGKNVFNEKSKKCKVNVLAGYKKVYTESQWKYFENINEIVTEK